ncbi:hypothetical protein DDB_G0268688 [Dictyostelium discoideum AX4]|uniref:Uncharacterized protein n=1 Tax=Dictyostelium discoideum TaxID=44689 RepID=Q55F05_DICDI|nr:hypothetical protein DDB_G0268688 [Dictyostelium discoideum AX4]EAL72933.1 hypothetical protein DDB_G0268688 [Dictyostelium discoideum AX4]|eukprot:XP_646865.1 hypothetical protein DDB_G0268688 [Dictyostelium discoideum AX4]
MIFTSLTKILNKSSSSSTLSKTFDNNSKSIAINFEKSNVQSTTILNNPLGPQGGVGPYF